MRLTNAWLMDDATALPIVVDGEDVAVVVDVDVAVELKMIKLKLILSKKIYFIDFIFRPFTFVCSNVSSESFVA